MSTEIPAKRTPLTMEQIRTLLRRVLAMHYGFPVAPEEPLLLALIANETRHGEAIWNNNIGNLVLGSSDRDYFYLPDNPRKFRAQVSPLAGMTDFIHVLLTQHREAYHAATRGDVDEFGRLIAERYVVAPEMTHALTESYRQLAAQFGAPIQQKAIRSANAAGVLFVLALGVGVLAYAKRKPRWW